MTELTPSTSLNDPTPNNDDKQHSPPPSLDDNSVTASESTCNMDDSVSATTTLDNADYLRQELQNRMQTEPELFEWLQKAALDGLWYWDLEQNENEWLSPDFKSLFGYEDHEVPNKSSWWQENIFPEDKEKAIEMFYKHVNEGTPYDSIVRYRHKDGSTVWVRCRGKASFNEDGIPVRMLGAHNDVTQLMKTQEELKKKKDVLDMLCTTALDGFWDWNMQTGEEFLSTRWKKALGYEEEDIDNTVEAWKSLLVPEDIPKALEAVQKHMEEGAPYSVVLRYKRKDGTIAHMLAQGVAQRDPNTGEWIRMFGTHTDVSYLEEARAARQASQAKTTFLATMSHEIRTPLNAVLGMAEVLMNTELTEEQRDCVNTLTNSGQHLLSLINDILDFSQIEAAQMTIQKSEFSVQETVREVVNALHLGAKDKGVTLTLDTAVPAGAKFVSDPERTRQIVFNLVGNAVKFTDAGGSVNVSLDVQKDGVRVAVQDTGCGMAPEHLAKIFDDFTQATREVQHKYGGSGLGLSISKKLVAAMGGTIDVESELHKGSTFVVWLPGIVPESLGKKQPSTSNNIVLLYEPQQINSDNNNDDADRDRGSVARGVRATGRDVVRLSNLTHLKENIARRDERHSALVVALGEDSGPPPRPGEDNNIGEEAELIGEILKQNLSLLLVDVGRRLGPDICVPGKAVRFRTLASFPTSDELEGALSFPSGQQSASSVKPTSLRKDCALGRLGKRDLNVLVVEDNRINVKVMLKLLARYPCDVKVAWNGQEAVEMAKESNKTFDLILMDMLMPVLGGVEATQEIRKFDNDTPVVALTANATTDDRESCLEAGMNDFLTKPISMDSLDRVLVSVAAKVTSEEGAEEPAEDVACDHPHAPATSTPFCQSTASEKMPVPRLNSVSRVSA